MAPVHTTRASKRAVADGLRLRDFLKEASARATMTISVPCPCRLPVANVASHNSYDTDGHQDHHRLQSRDQMSSVSNRRASKAQSTRNFQENATSHLAFETTEPQLNSSSPGGRRSHSRTATTSRSHNISIRSTTSTLLLTLTTLGLLITHQHSNNGRSAAQTLAQSYGPSSSHDLSPSTSQQAHQAAAASTQESNPQPVASTASASAACFGGLQTFEKIAMSSFENPAAGSNSAPGGGGGANSNPAFDSGILVQQDDQALTSECINLCRSQSNCLSFVIDYNKFECKSYATTQQELQQEFAAKFQSARAANPPGSSSGGGNGNQSLDSLEANSQPGGYQASASSSSFNFQQLLPSTSSNYFEKICLDGVANRNQFSDVCGPGRLWTVERVVDSFLDGFVEKEVTNVNNKDECSKLCLFETQFVCRSADYDTQARLCRLSKEDRRTQPQAMRYVGSSGRQYLENQCATPGPSSCVYETKRNVGIISMDALKFAQTAQDCQMKCNQETSFNCRSYSFHQQRCFLSGDDSTSLNSNLIKLPAKQGWAFGEKKCLVELCTKGIFSYERITGYTLRSALSTSIDLMMPGGSSPPSAFVASSSSASTSETLQSEASSKMRPRHLMPPGARAYNGSSSSLASAMMMMMTQSNQQVADPLQESASSRHTRASGGSNLAITEHCRHSCDLGYLNCPAFTVDYKNNRCQRLDRNSQGRHQELVARDGFAYYEKICLRVPEIMSMCQDKYWIFERVLGYELAPRLYDKSLKFVQSRRDCEEYCLEEKQFQCRSALYNDETSDCKLSRLNRRLALQEGGYYRNYNARISYLENNCVRDHQLERKQCHYEQTKDEPAYPTFTERIEMALPVAMSPGSTEMESASGGYNTMRTGGGGLHNSSASQMRQGSSFCEQLCNDNSKFECHAFGYYASTAQCFLSGDDSISAGDMASTPSTGFRYYEKKCRLGILNNTTGGEGEESPGTAPGGGGTSQEPPSGQNLNPYFQPPMNQEPPPAIGTTTPTMNEFQTGAGDAQQPPPTPSGDVGSGGGSGFSPANTFHQRPQMTSHNNNSAQEPNNQNYDADAYKCGAGHTFVYQRISGFEPIGGYLTLLTKNNDHPGIVAECSELCRRAYECRAFVVDYASNQCYAMLENSSVGLLSLRQILGKDYFEGFCVANHLLVTSVATAASVGNNSCRNKTWIMDKIVDQAVVGVQHSKLIPDSDRAQCRQACLEERLFMCKSAMYDSASGECKLYSIDRESVPQMRLIFTKGVDFFENQCQITSSSCPYDAIERDMTIITVTKSVQARSTFDCELACNSELGFNCRSYTYLDQYPSLPNLCLLSSDSRSTSQRGSVKEHQRTLYAERNCYYRRPRFPGGGGGGGSPGHKLDHGYSPPLFLGEGPSGTMTGDSSPPRPQPPISPLMVDPYGGSIHHNPERTSANPQQSNTEQEGAVGPQHELPGAGLAPGQGACEPHQFTFERTFGYDFKLAPKERAPIAPTIGIAIGCQKECLRRGDKCQSFVVDYALPYQSCFLLDTQAGANKRALVRAPNSAYFEKVCLPRTGLLQVDIPTAANSNSEPTIDHQMLPPLALNPAPLTMLQRLQQLYQPTQSSATSVLPPLGEPLDSLQSLDISPSYSQEPWSLKRPHEQQQPPAHASQLPYYLQQQQLVRNYPSRSCAKLWTFERFVNYNFTAPVDKLLEESLTRVQCETACLNEASFSCRAATYDYTNKLCRLFKNTRRTIMSQFIDLTLPGSPGAVQQAMSSSGQVMSSHPGTAHVLDSTATTADQIQAAASTGNDLDGASSRRQSGMRQLIGGAASSQTGSGQHAQQQVSPPSPTGGGGTHMTAEPLNPSKNIDYLENTCTPEPSSCQYRQVYDQFSPYIDKVVHAKTLAECQRQCDQERLFSCKSVNYDPSSRNCMLVNEDLISLTRGGGGGSSQTPLLPKKNAIYSEKGNCEMISVQCNSQEMLVTINFDSPFRGRIMAKGNPEQCYALGDGQTSMQFPIVFGPKCNSRQEGHNTFVNEVVIQQHPVIMTESDKTVRVMCAFEAPEQTITLSKNPNSARGDNKTMAGIDVGTPDTSRTRHDKQQFNSVVSSKAAPPSVMLRILDQAGRDASMINLGDDLMLKIQMHAQAPEGAKSSGALGIFARNLAARSSNGESLLLIDNEGCPVDPQVFPALEIDPKDGKSLLSTFKAFRFPSSGLVNFEVQIRFCPERCQPVDCHSTSPHKSRSYGRRRRRKRQASAAQDEQVVAGRAAILQSVDQTSQQDQPQPAAPILPTLDSLSTVMKPGKAFEYVRKLMLPQQQQEPPASHQVVEQSSQPDQNQSVSGSGTSHVSSDQEVTSQQVAEVESNGGNQPANGDKTPTMTNVSEQQQQQNEDFDSHALPAQGPSQDEQTGGTGQFSPPDLTSSSQSQMGNGDQFVPSVSMAGSGNGPVRATSERPSITMHVDARVVPAQPQTAMVVGGSGGGGDQFATRANFNQLNLAPYGHFRPTPTRVETPHLDPISIQEPTRTSDSDPQQQDAGNHNSISSPPVKSSDLADETTSTNSNLSDQHESQGEGVKVPLDQSPPPPPRIQHSPGQQSMQGKDMPLRFSILVGENQAPTGGPGGGGGAGQPVLIMNSTSMDLDHIVIPGKKGQFESTDSDPSMNSPTLSTTATATSSPTGGGSYMDSNYLDSGTSAGVRSVGRTRDTNKRNASYEQTFDTLPSSSVSSEIHIHQQQQQHDDMSTSSGSHHLQVNEHPHNSDHNHLHHHAGRSSSHRSQQQQHLRTAVGSESAASHDCQIESSRSRLQAIIWTGSIVISLNVCLVLLSLVLYFRKVHSRQNSHSIVSSSSDFGTSTRSGGLSRLGGASSVLSGDGGGGGSGRGRLGGSQWPSVILKSKSKLGTSLNAHEHFFCKLNTKPGAGASGSAAGLEHDFNWPNLSTSSSHSTISSLASGPLPSTSIRINQMRPSLKSVPFDAHSSLRNGNFDTTTSDHHHGEADHEKNEYTARYTNNIDVLHNERF